MNLNKKSYFWTDTTLCNNSNFKDIKKMADQWHFDRFIDRRNTGSEKWEPSVLEHKFGKGRKNLLPLWVADMDFECPDVIF